MPEPSTCTYTHVQRPRQAQGRPKAGPRHVDIAAPHLQVVLWVPVAVKDDAGVGRSQGDALPARLSGQQEHKGVGLAAGGARAHEAVNGCLWQQEEGRGPGARGARGWQVVLGDRGESAGAVVSSQGASEQCSGPSACCVQAAVIHPLLDMLFSDWGINGPATGCGKVETPAWNTAGQPQPQLAWGTQGQHWLD